MAETTVTKKVGLYEVDRELGRGAFGVVYRAFHPDDPETPVALKVVETRGSIDRVMAEPALLARLDHPCINRVLDYFQHGKDRLAIALEFIGGGDLKTFIDDGGRFPESTVRELLVQIGSALAEAHAQGIVHRDLKPANILIDRTSPRVRYVLTDFGVGGEDTGIRAAKQLAGTFLFMAPEQLRGRPGPQSDLWALGVIAYLMLTGKYPFPGPSLADIARQIQLTTPLPPSAASGEPIDPTLERIILRLLDRSESERLGSAKELLRELGFKGDSHDVLDAEPSRPSGRTALRQQSLVASLSRSVRRNYIWTGVWTAGFLAFSPLSGLVALAGFMLFYRAHNRFAGWRRFTLILAGIALLGSSWFARGFDLNVNEILMKANLNGYFLPSAPQQNPLHILLISTALMLLMIIVPILPAVSVALACGAYGRANRFRRERTLLRAAI
ncbi:MAG TPA: serine/threonine-protein kinase, partial [Gemmata sp.]|nr:serine/threonine-protein kinase [Gemmata sp.]